jgi:integrase
MALLTDLKARKMVPGGKPLPHGQVPGLRLEPGAKKGEGKWILRFVSPVTGTRRDMGIGRYPDVGISAARIKGLAARELIAAGKDPIDERLAERAEIKVRAQALTFEDAARKVHAELKPAWRNGKHRDQWINTLRDYVFPTIGSRKVADLTPGDFADVLRPIWLAKPETAGRVKQRCETVMRWCWAHGLVSANPVAVVDHLLPQRPAKRERVRHQPAMPWRDVADFVRATIRAETASSTRSLLEFIILTAARSGEARAAQWDELDLEARIWTVPATRMKTKITHRVPLSDRAVEILAAQRKEHPKAKLVFPAPRGSVLSDMALTAFLRRHKAKSSDVARFATAHGFRSSFRDWASENGYSRELAERALAHTVANKVEAAYNRTDLLEQRRAMMAAWSVYVEEGASTAKVIPIRSKGARGRG